MWFEALLFVVSIVAGAIAAVAGFGIGSLLTPLLALVIGTRLAVAAVSVPHLIGTVFRLWLLGTPPDRRVLWRFGVASAAGGLAGAVLQSSTGGPGLTVVLGTLLALTCARELFGWAERLRVTGVLAWSAGAVSGLLGGLVGNQGGIRSAALLGFGLDRTTFIATATAIGLIVDAARMPFYVWSQGEELAGHLVWMAVATVGVMLGTVVGSRALAHIPESRFRRLVAGVVGVLGVVMIVRGVWDAVSSEGE